VEQKSNHSRDSEAERSAVRNQLSNYNTTMQRQQTDT